MWQILERTSVQNMQLLTVGILGDRQQLRLVSLVVRRKNSNWVGSRTIESSSDNDLVSMLAVFLRRSHISLGTLPKILDRDKPVNLGFPFLSTQNSANEAAFLKFLFIIAYCCFNRRSMIGSWSVKYFNSKVQTDSLTCYFTHTADRLCKVKHTTSLVCDPPTSHSWSTNGVLSSQNSLR